MLIAVVVTLLDRQIVSYGLILIGTALGAVIAVYLARTVKMTAVPQMVALLNGMGGGAAATVAVSEFLRESALGGIAADAGVASLFGVIVGGVTFSGR